MSPLGDNPCAAIIFLPHKRLVHPFSASISVLFDCTSRFASKWNQNSLGITAERSQHSKEEEAKEQHSSSFWSSLSTAGMLWHDLPAHMKTTLFTIRHLYACVTKCACATLLLASSCVEDALLPAYIVIVYLLS